MNITKDTVVSFHYSLSDEEQELESSLGGEPSLYLHGANNIIPGLEAEMAGKSAGDSFSVTLAPQDAYGLRNAERLQKVPVKHLVYRGKLRPGMAVELNTDKGRQAVTVVKVGRHSAEIDSNHPLAGHTLTFAIEIVEVRAATADEIQHGHAHGPGGHLH